MKEFFLDLVNRFLTNNPKFFKVIQVISVVIAAVTGLPLFIEQIGVVLPETITVLSNKIIAIASVVAALIAQLPNKDK
jgi:hypothetical protein